MLQYKVIFEILVILCHFFVVFPAFSERAKYKLFQVALILKNNLFLLFPASLLESFTHTLPLCAQWDMIQMYICEPFIFYILFHVVDMNNH